MVLRKKLLSIFTSALMVVGTLPIIPGTAYAEDAPEPAEIQDLHTIDGVNYYNTASENFSNSNYEFIKDALGTGYIDFARDGDEPLDDLRPAGVNPAGRFLSSYRRNPKNKLLKTSRLPCGPCDALPLPARGPSG